MGKSRKEPSEEVLAELRGQIREWRAGKLPETGLVKPTFVQLPATLASDSQPAGTTIEIFARDGARMRIQVEAGRGMDAAGIVAAFLGSRG